MFPIFSTEPDPGACPGRERVGGMGRQDIAGRRRDIVFVNGQTGGRRREERDVLGQWAEKEGKIKILDEAKFALRRERAGEQADMTLRTRQLKSKVNRQDGQICASFLQNPCKQIHKFQFVMH